MLRESGINIFELAASMRSIDLVPYCERACHMPLNFIIQACDRESGWIIISGVGRKATSEAKLQIIKTLAASNEEYRSSSFLGVLFVGKKSVFIAGCKTS